MNLPILMYHSVKPQASAHNDLTVTTAAFQAQLQYLNKRGFQTVTLAHVAKAAQGRARLPRRSVVITFDDGYAALLEYAKPLLDLMGFTATVFVVGQALGRHNFWDEGKGLAREQCMTRSHLAELQGAGWEIGAHGLTHASLPGLAAGDLRRETEEAKHLLETELETRVEVFSYPYGAWDAAAREAVRQAGYVAACAISPGTRSVTADPWALRRVYVKPTDSLGDFARKISGWYLAFRAWKRR
jgi:peptidoglycan/xylan/chitin deacetylase (PgdA/CDA1 family)